MRAAWGRTSIGRKGEGAAAPSRPRLRLIGALVRPSQPESVGLLSGGWLVTLSDCMLLLLTFFVMLFAMSSVQKDRWRDLSAAIVDAMRPITALDPRPFPRPFAATDSGAGKRDIDYMAALLGGTLARDRALAGVSVQRVTEGLAIRLPPTAFADDALSPSGRAALLALVERLRLVDNDLVLRVRLAPDDMRWAAAMKRGLALSAAAAELGFPRTVPVLGGLEAESAGPNGIELVLRPARAGGQ